MNLNRFREILIESSTNNLENDVKIELPDYDKPYVMGIIHLGKYDLSGKIKAVVGHFAFEQCLNSKQLIEIIDLIKECYGKEREAEEVVFVFDEMTYVPKDIWKGNAIPYLYISLQELKGIDFPANSATMPKAYEITEDESSFVILDKPTNEEIIHKFH